MPGPNRAITTTARKKRGTTWTNSVIRISTSSRAVPYQPAVVPTAMPSSAASAVTARATRSDVRVPWTTPAMRSRPRSSVPMMCAAEGGAQRRADRSEGVARGDPSGQDGDEH